MRKGRVPFLQSPVEPCERLLHIVAGTVALCLASGEKSCVGLTPAQIVKKIVADAAAYNTLNPGYGFTGDPLRPVEGKYYGYLIHAGSY